MEAKWEGGGSCTKENKSGSDYFKIVGCFLVGSRNGELLYSLESSLQHFSVKWSRGGCGGWVRLSVRFSS